MHPYVGVAYEVPYPREVMEGQVIRHGGEVHVAGRGNDG